MTDQQPPTGPQEPTVPSEEPRWDPPGAAGTPGGQPLPPSPPPAGQPPAYPPPAYGQQPDSGQPYQDQAAPQRPFGQQPLGEPTYGDVVASAPAKGRRGLALGGGALVLALVAGGGLYAATQAGEGGGGQPEDLVPSTAYAFVKIDLDPAADQKVAIHEFSSKIPKAPKTTAADPIDGLLREVFKDKAGKCSYEADIKPWLGKRIGIAAISAAGGKTRPLVLMQVKDAAKAKAAESKLTSDVCSSDSSSKSDLKGFAVKDGYAVMSETQADVDAALTSAKTRSLKRAGTFASDVGKLDGSQVVVVWADVARSFEAIAKENPRLNALPNGIAKQLTGRVVLGLHMASNYAELSGRLIGGDLSAAKYGSPTALTKLPKSTVVAASVNGLQAQIEKQLSQLGAGGLNLDQMLGAASSQLGLDVRRDLLPLLGSTTTLSLGNVPTSPLDAEFGLQSTVTDPAAAAAAGAKLKGIAAKQGIELDAEVAGTTFYLTSKGYAATLKGDGGLGSSPVFAAAMGTLGTEVAGAVFVDIGQLGKLRKGAGGADMAYISAFGFSSGKDGDDGYLRMRLVVK